MRRAKEWAVILLIEQGANPHEIDKWGRQALHYAVEAGQESMVKVLLDHDGIQHVTACPPHGTTLLHLAVVGGNLTIIEMILKAGADTNKQNSSGYTSLHELIRYGSANLEQIIGLLLKFGAQVNIGNDSDITPLHIAVLCRPEVVQMLLDAGADPYLVNCLGETAMEVARKWVSRRSSDPRRKEIWEILSSHTNPLFAKHN